MTPDRKKPGVAFWATVGMVCLLVLYLLGVGPAMWIAIRWQPAERIIAAIYWPCGWIAQNGPRPIRNLIAGYVSLGMPDDDDIPVLPTTPDGGWTGFVMP